jgi:uncharacterized protein
LSDSEFGAWQRVLGEAWAIIERDLPAYAEGIGAGLSVIVPLASPERGQDVSATARDAFGAVAIALPRDAATLALLLIHEFQHVKLGAVLDLFDLSDPADSRYYYAPWRDDPRPLEGLLQGAYAHVAVADYWRVQSVKLGITGDALQAAAAFARWRDEVLDVIDTMSRSGSLTRLGERFVAGMRRRVEAWSEIPVPATALEIAAKARRQHRQKWVEAHGNGACHGHR